MRYTLRRLGLSYTPQDELTIAGFTGVVARDTGVPFRDLSDVDKTKEDVYAFAATRINEATGLVIERLDDPQYLRDFVANIALSAARTQAPNAMLGAAFIRQMQHAARDAYRDGFVTSLGLPWSQRLYRWSHREAVRRYGQSHIQVWEFEDIVTKRKVFGRHRTTWTAKECKKFWRYNCKQWKLMILGDPDKRPRPILSVVDGIITHKNAPDRLTITELQRLRKRLGLKPLVRRGSHPWRWIKEETPGRFGR